MMENINVVIRQETPADFPAVYSVNTSAFNRNEEATLVDRLRGSKSFIPQLSLVATIDNKVVGYILFTRVNIIGNGHNEEGLALAPVAVFPEWQRKGIGSKLVNSGIEAAKKLEYKSVVVLGHEQYYPRFGFKPTNRWGIKPPFHVSDNLFMGLELVENALSDVQGTVVYSKEFQLR